MSRKRDRNEDNREEGVAGESAAPGDTAPNDAGPGNTASEGAAPEHTTPEHTAPEHAAPDAWAKPVPRLTPDNRPFWEGCRQHRIMLPTCRHCDRPHWPPGPICPFCFSDSLCWTRASGRGVVSSWVVVHKGWLPAFQADLPYNAVQVELEEGVRLTGNVVGVSNDALHVGMRVEAVFDDVTPEVTLPRFRPR